MDRVWTKEHRFYYTNHEGQNIKIGDEIYIRGSQPAKFGVFLGALDDWGFSYIRVATGPGEVEYWDGYVCALLTKWSIPY